MLIPFVEWTFLLLLWSFMDLTFILITKLLTGCVIQKKIFIEQKRISRSFPSVYYYNNNRYEKNILFIYLLFQFKLFLLWIGFFMAVFLWFFVILCRNNAKVSASIHEKLKRTCKLNSCLVIILTFHYNGVVYTRGELIDTAEKSRSHKTVHTFTGRHFSSIYVSSSNFVCMLFYSLTSSEKFSTVFPFFN